ncbi:serine/arginine repetitive matrix protein 4-like [Xyrauchen texanus]|uniref:serine/arginine repetitive matrix protein 4-like n=1 Tax=Xyrauchen texanus TaxID=154827 RepID=UPI0022420355|nr:serine/arginine repetitive matrix protein 4-like [Xyrauchen texanus]
MAGALEGEKQLFEKFWKGTFKAVAMPRPESIIVASITARRAVSKLETAVTLAPKDDKEKVETKDTVAKTHEKNRHIKHRGRKHRSHHRARSVSFDADLSPRPVYKAKKKKKKSERKRRRQSPSHVRKKKKKKSSKKRKHHRSASRKGRHSVASPRYKRKEDKKHKKRSRSHSHRKHRHRKVEIRSSPCMEIRYEDCEKADFHDGGHSSADHRGDACSSAIKLTNQISSKCCCRLSESTVLPSRPWVEGLNKMVIVKDSLSNKGKEHADYDSGNDTSSPPSSKTGITRSKVVGNKKVSYQELTSPMKLRLADGDNASDSGNSLTSYDSLGKPLLRDNTLHSSVFNKLKGEEMGRYSDFEKTPLGLGPDRNQRPSYDRYQHRTRSRSRSASSQSRYSGRYSRSRSRSSGRRSYSHSSSYSLDSRRDSLSSASCCHCLSYTRCTTDRFRERKRNCRSCESKKHNRRRPCSPMRKRRRDSPSHLEARRITSARKRPIPYYRPSPSVSSRSSSLLSWRLFSLSRSRSRSRNKSRSHTYSSYRSYSRSSSWNSLDSRSSRSRSYDSMVSYSRARR